MARIKHELLLILLHGSKFMMSDENDNAKKKSSCKMFALNFIETLSVYNFIGRVAPCDQRCF